MESTRRKPGPVPKAVRKQRTCRIPVSIDDRVSEIAAQRGLAVGDAVVALLAQALEVDEPEYIAREVERSRRAQQQLPLGA